MKARVFKSIFVLLLAVGLTLGIIVATEGNVAQAAPVVAPGPETIAAESVFVGGVELQNEQYVMNGSSTAVDGNPAGDANGLLFTQREFCTLSIMLMKDKDTHTKATTM